jgi:TonB-dependent starch-binding outer membrane protein SusC
MKKMTNSKKLFFLNSHFKKSFFVALVLLLQALFVSEAFAQNKTVKGRITDESGKPVQKATVLLKGTSGGTSSDDNGGFEISVPANGTIVISAVDFVTQELKPGNRTNLNVTLVSANKDLTEVVVVGYGTQRKEAITGSVASINGDKIREVPAPNISQALQGRIAGVEISQTSTRPGATMQIRIRGTRSLSADNNPLIVLDGIPFVGSIADINPDDIKSLDILKDASATAIYGSRGANGVILVTTDKGSRNRKPRINYSAYVGSQKGFILQNRYCNRS